MKKIISFILLFTVLLTCGIGGTVYALTPMDNFYVNDYVGILTKKQTDEMVRRAEFLREENGVQVVTVIVDNYIGESISEYANNIFNEFGIGSANDLNGILLMVAIDDRSVRIEVGDGMLGYLPDSKTGRILDDYFIPYAKDDDFSTAVYETYMELIKSGSRLSTVGVPRSSQANTDVYYERGILSGIFSAIGQLIRSIMGFMIIAAIVTLILYGKRRRRRRITYDDPRTTFNPFGTFGPFGPFGPFNHHHGHNHEHHTHHDSHHNSGGFGGFGGGNSGGGGSSNGSGSERNF